MSSAHKQAVGSKNCMQCSVAYMLGLPLTAVPDFEQYNPPDAWENMERFFEERGFTVEMFPPTVEIGGDYLAAGETVRGTFHMVVMRNGNLLHDPHPSNAGLLSAQIVWLIVRKAGAVPQGGKPCRSDGRCQYAIDHGAEGLGACPTGVCVMAQGGKP